jgi:hypothetical protein
VKLAKGEVMKLLSVIAVPALLVAGVIILPAQDRATVQVDKRVPFRAGGPATFDPTLNEPLPKGARFDFRISPTAADEEITLGTVSALDDSGKRFRVSGSLPDGALPGVWHVSVIWLFLPGAGWTHNTISTNNLKFEVEGRPYSIPTKGDVEIAK